MRAATGFAKESIRLHIDGHCIPVNHRLPCILGSKLPTDDGCLGGGEDDIEYKYSDDLDINAARDIYEYTPESGPDITFFQNERRSIFSYCLLSKGIDNPDDPKNAYTLEKGKAFVLPLNDGSGSQIAEGFGNYLAFHNLVNEVTVDINGEIDFDGDGLNYWAEEWFESAPDRKDTDEDGNDDIWEAEHSVFPYIANPIRADIFIEFDWMLGNPHGAYGAIDPDAYKFSNTVVNRVINAYSNHGITLHIDDGDLGGGKRIDYFTGKLSDEKFNGEGDEDINDEDTIYGKYFTDSRRHNFYYAFVCKGLADSADGRQWTRSFVISHENMGAGGFFVEKDKAQTFIHELGHCEGLEDGCENQAEGHEDDWIGGFCAMKKSKGSSPASSYVCNYCSSCWDEVERNFWAYSLW